MSDPSAELQVAIIAAIENDAGVAAAFGGHAVEVFDYPPVNAVEPYVVVGEAGLLSAQAEGYDGADEECTVHVWSRVQPQPSLIEAKRIGDAVQAAMLAIDDLPSFRLSDRDLVRAQYMFDPDGETAHGVVVVRFPGEPK